MSSQWSEHGRTAADAVKRGAEATSNGIHTVTNFVARSDDLVADGVQMITQDAGVSLARDDGCMGNTILFCHMVSKAA